MSTAKSTQCATSRSTRCCYEFLKEHKTVQELKSTVKKQEAIIAEQQKSFESSLAEQKMQIKALASGLQKVSAEVEINRSAPQTASLPAIVRQLPDKDGNNP